MHCSSEHAQFEKKRQIKEFPAVLIHIIFYSKSLFEDTCYSNT